MKVDPNQAIEYYTECVLCEKGEISFYFEKQIIRQLPSATDGEFRKFCQSLDPNKCYIQGIIPDDSDKDIFFYTRDVASEYNIHMQALVDTPNNHRAHWESYITMKNAPTDQDSISD